jgi:Mg2+-importing ATPase
LLVFAATVSLVTHDWFDAAVVLLIVAITAAIGFFREYQAKTAADELRQRIELRAAVIRDGQVRSVPAAQVVAGDVVLLSAGNLVPADAVILESRDLFVNESMLTGESFPVEKRPGPTPAQGGVARRRNCVFLGSNVRSGTARCVVIETGDRTQFGTIARRLKLRQPETEFDRGLRRFGYLLAKSMFVLVLVVFTANILLGRPATQTLMFSVALAVGLSPELLPVILSVSLARGAQLMAARGVLVRRLGAIENLGSIDVLCTDKTGTLTDGVVKLEGSFDTSGMTSSATLKLASVNSALQTGLANPLDQAILAAQRTDLSGVSKLAEVPYDFVRKRMSVVIRDASGVHMVTKGAVEELLGVCVRDALGMSLGPAHLQEIRSRVACWNAQGLRVLAVAVRPFDGDVAAVGRGDEREMELLGFHTFLDRPKRGAGEAIAGLRQLGVGVKVITGDAEAVAGTSPRWSASRQSGC